MAAQVSLCGDGLRLLNQALNSLSKVRELREWREEAYNALTDLLRALIALHTGKVISRMELTSIAAIALDRGLIDPRTYAEIVRINLGLHKFLNLSRDDFIELFEEILRELAEKDAYLSPQLNLFRY